MIKRNVFTSAIIGVAMTALAATSGWAQQGPQAGLVDVIVVLDDTAAPGGGNANRAAAAAFARGLGFNPRFAYGSALFGFAASVPEAALTALENNPRVKYVERDRIAFASAPKWCTPDSTHPACSDGGGEDPAPGGQVTPWGIDRVGALLSGNTGAGINVYVLDTGIDLEHTDLAVIGEWDCTGGGGPFGGGSCEPGPGVADDKNGHGTHVAGTIAALDNTEGVVGMAPEANLYAVKVLGNGGSGSFSGIIAGIDTVTAQGGHPSVINMSLGGSGEKTGSCINGVFNGDDALHEAVCNATDAGVVVVVAAGNSGDDAANHVPAAYDDTVITVSATDINDNFPSFSNYGSAVAIAAPGVNVLSTWKGGGTNEISGTSMASPHVAGAVALWLEAHPTQAADDTAYANARGDLLFLADSTAGWGEPSGKPHPEPFLDASGL